MAGKLAAGSAPAHPLSLKSPARQLRRPRRQRGSGHDGLPVTSCRGYSTVMDHLPSDSIWTAVGPAGITASPV